LLRCTPEQLIDVTLRDHINQFRSPKGKILLPAIKEQQAISAQNSISYREGKFTKISEIQAKHRYVAQFLARSQEAGSADQVDRLTKQYLSAQPLATQIAFFVEWGGMEQMRAYKVEGMLTARQWERMPF
jgi:hypothetical protein